MDAVAEIVFIVEESPQGGFVARAQGHSIFTEAQTEAELRVNIRDAIHCHFEGQAPTTVRLHFVREQIFTL
jgi:hypothetical protein